MAPVCIQLAAQNPQGVPTANLFASNFALGLAIISGEVSYCPFRDRCRIRYFKSQPVANSIFNIRFEDMPAYS